jgi:RNA polymerase sigma-70 factor (ECF subfamily)
MPVESRDERRSRFESETVPWMRALYGFAVRLARDPEDASDLVQECYLRAFRTFDNFTSGTNAKAWLFKILFSVFANDRRKKSRQRVMALEELEPHFDRAALDAWKGGRGAGRAVEDAAALEEALACLPDEFRAVVLLVDVEGLTYDEASQALDCPVGTVRSRLSRARRALFVILSGDVSPRYPSTPEDRG